MKLPTITLEITDWRQCFTTITAFIEGQGRVEFRGDAYWQWDGNPIRSHGKSVCWAELLHNTLEGWHACVLHTGEAVAVLPKHSEYHLVARLIQWGEILTDREVAVLLEGGALYRDWSSSTTRSSSRLRPVV